MLLGSSSAVVKSRTCLRVSTSFQVIFKYISPTFLFFNVLCNSVSFSACLCPQIQDLLFREIKGKIIMWKNPVGCSDQTCSDPKYKFKVCVVTDPRAKSYLLFRSLHRNGSSKSYHIILFCSCFTFFNILEEQGYSSHYVFGKDFF